MPSFRAVTSARGNIAGIVRAFEIKLGLEAGALGPRVAAALADATARGVATLVIVHELVALFNVLKELDTQLDRRGAENTRARQIQDQLDRITAVISDMDSASRIFVDVRKTGGVITQQSL